jgi:hypothetical protein
MTATTGSTHPGGAAGPGRTRHVLLRDELGRLSLRRLRPWHRVLARCAAPWLDRELAAGTSPETSVALAARAIQLTSMKFRHDLAASLQRSRAQISQLTGPLARLAGYPARCRSRCCPSSSGHYVRP